MLTNKKIDRLRPNQTIWDTKVLGLGARRRTTKGAISFILYARIQNRKVGLTIGKYLSPWSIDEARTEARRLLLEISRDQDPRQRTEQDDSTVNEMAQLFLEKHVLVNNKPSHQRNQQLNLRRHILPAIGRKQIASVSRKDIAALLEDTRETSGRVTADRVLATVSKMWNWALLQSRWIDVIQTTPVTKGMNTNSTGKRRRVLSSSEIASLFAIEDDVFADIYKFLLLTGVRKDEAANMKLSDISGDVWNITDTKTNEPHVVYLSEAALSIVSGRRINDPEAYVFCAGFGALSGWSRATNRIRQQVGGQQDWRPHDLRRTFATILQDADVEDSIIKACLNHADPSVTALYKRSDLIKQRKRCVVIVEDYVKSTRSNEDEP